jgi:hypothetical protein
MGQELFPQKKYDPMDKPLYDAVLAVEKGRLAQSDYFICIVPPGSPQNASLKDLIEHAKSLKKPIYVLAKKGELPASLEGADVRAIEYHGVTKESMTVAVTKILQRARQDFPGAPHSTHQAPDLSDIINWPPEE